MYLVIRCNGYTLVGARATDTWKLKPWTDWGSPFYSGNPRRCGIGRNGPSCPRPGGGTPFDIDYPLNYCFDSPGFSEPCRTRWQGT